MQDLKNDLFQQIRTALDISSSVKVFNQAKLPSRFAVSELAAMSMAAVGVAVSELIQDLGLTSKLNEVSVDQRLASLWFVQSFSPVDWQMPPIWDAIAGDYRTDDGWIKLHTNLPAHKAAALEVLGVDGDRETVMRAVEKWRKDELEAAIVAAGGVAAAMRSCEGWQVHPQGSAVAQEPLIAWHSSAPGTMRAWPATQAQPLKRLRVLDLTRVLAGPVATRALASLGADVLRVDPPWWDEQNVVPDITFGKRCCFLNLTEELDRQRFEKLLSTADVLVHGYRPGALEGLGYGDSVRQQLSPNLIEVSLDAYGWSGPWSTRRGFDSLVQMSCGIAHAGMLWMGNDEPTPLPVQALDHATGYLMAAAVVRALTRAVNHGKFWSARLSLARTGALLVGNLQEAAGELSKQPSDEDFLSSIEVTPWGSSKRLRSALNITGVSMNNATPACDLGSAKPVWL
jgi:hypothetical protein